MIYTAIMGETGEIDRKAAPKPLTPYPYCDKIIQIMR